MHSFWKFDRSGSLSAQAGYDLDSFVRPSHSFDSAAQKVSPQGTADNLNHVPKSGQRCQVTTPQTVCGTVLREPMQAGNVLILVCWASIRVPVREAVRHMGINVTRAHILNRGGARGSVVATRRLVATSMPLVHKIGIFRWTGLRMPHLQPVLRPTGWWSPHPLLQPQPQLNAKKQLGL